MSIQFSEIPSDNLVPMFLTEFDNTNAAKSGAMPWKNLIIGQPLSGKSETELKQITSDEAADTLYGAGSQLALMIRAFRKNTKNSELWVLPVADAASSAKASGKMTVTVAGDVLAAFGVVRLMVGGQKVPVNVTAGYAASDVAKAISDALNDVDNLPVTAAATESVVTITAKNAGTCGAGIDLRVNHYQGEELPTGLSLSIEAMKDAGADPKYEDALIKGKIDGTWFNAIAIGSSESANVSYVKELLDERWTATVQETGVCLFSPNGNGKDSGTASLETVTERAEALNSQVVVLAAIPEREGLEGNNAILKSGAALLTASNDGSVYLKRTVTTYKRTANGAKDTSYQQLEKVFTLSFLRWDWNNYLAGRYPHAKLADDGTDFRPGQVVMTPKLGEAELLGRYEYWISKGLVQDYATFKANLVVARDPDDDTALQFLIPADLIDQFFIGKSKIQFK